MELRDFNSTLKSFPARLALWAWECRSSNGLVAPERRNADRVLPLIPNEIYLEILELIAPSAEDLTREQTRIFTRLSCVCRFFANFCLPRIFEHLEFSGSLFRNDRPVPVHPDPIRESRESTLCTQLVEKQPLALALAQKVKVCHFTDWKLDDSLWAVRLFVKKYITGLTHMTHICQLEFSNSDVGAEHWNAIGALEELEYLFFDRCRFLRGPADEEPEKRIQVKLACLQVNNCNDYRQPFAAVDVQHLRILALDLAALDHVDWPSQSALKELCIHSGKRSCLVNRRYIKMMHDVLIQVPPSVESLWLPLGVGAKSPRGIVRRILDGPEGKILPQLRSLKLTFHISDAVDGLSLILDGIGLVTGLQSLELIQENHHFFRRVQFAEIWDILHENLDIASSLRHVYIDGMVLHSVNGEWLDRPHSGE